MRGTLACLLGVLVPATLAAEGPVVKTSFGVVKGVYMQSEPNNRKFSAFLSIPYAQPPVGPLRFQPPLETEEFFKPNEPLDATKYRSDCAQLELKTLKFKGSEDCLYLNVFTPDFKFNGNQELPVMVWIHGGGFLFGSSDPSFYGPERFLDFDVVLVTINYRLGALGFLSNGAESNPANNGIMDQILALKWVKQNIKTFGGDPDKVTIFGESAGGDSVMALLSSPRAAGLYNQAISMSGSYGLTNMFLHNSRKLPHYTSILALELGCDTLNTSEDTINCLREKPAEEILSKASLFTRYNFLLNPFKPTPDPEAVDPVLPFKLNDIWTNQTNFDVPLMIGGNKDEGIMSFLDFLSDEKLFKPVEDQFFIEGPILLLSTDPDVAERDEAETATAEVMKKKYLNDKKFSKEASKEIINMLTDVHYLASIDYTVKKLVSKKTTPTYYYNYQHQGSFSVPMAFGFLERMGVCHADELFLMFRNEDVSKSWLGDLALQTEEDIHVSRKLLEMWTEFAATGHPSADRVWSPAEDSEKPKYAVIDSKAIRMERPADFSDRMLFVQNMMELVYNHRNFDVNEHPLLKQMEADRIALAEAEMKQQEFDWKLKENAGESKDSKKEDLDKDLEEEIREAFPEEGENDPMFKIEEGNIEAAMEFLMNLEDQASAEVERIKAEEKEKGIIRDEL